MNYFFPVNILTCSLDIERHYEIMALHLRNITHNPKTTFFHPPPVNLKYTLFTNLNAILQEPRGRRGRCHHITSCHKCNVVQPNKMINRAPAITLFFGFTAAGSSLVTKLAMCMKGGHPSSWGAELVEGGQSYKTLKIIAHCLEQRFCYITSTDGSTVIGKSKIVMNLARHFFR